MIETEGQVTFEVVKLSTRETEQVEVDASELNAECRLLETEDDKRRVSVELLGRFRAFDGDAEFVVVLYYQVFDLKLQEHRVTFVEVTAGYAVTLIADMPGDGLSVIDTRNDPND